MSLFNDSLLWRIESSMAFSTHVNIPREQLCVMHSPVVQKAPYLKSKAQTPSPNVQNSRQFNPSNTCVQTYFS